MGVVREAVVLAEAGRLDGQRRGLEGLDRPRQVPEFGRVLHVVLQLFDFVFVELFLARL